MSRSPWTESKKTRARDGAHRLTTPVVGCAQATTGRPPGGAGGGGPMTTPETGIGSPDNPVELYKMRHAEAPSGAPGIGCAWRSVPGGTPLPAAFARALGLSPALSSAKMIIAVNTGRAAARI